MRESERRRELKRRDMRIGELKEMMRGTIQWSRMSESCNTDGQNTFLKALMPDYKPSVPC